MTDAYTDELFQSDLLGASTVHYPVSRIVVDPERFESDAEESMARVGMGVIYTKTSDRPSTQEVANRIRAPGPCSKRITVRIIRN
jgi:N-formylglutamate amidohydrolase